MKNDHHLFGLPVFGELRRAALLMTIAAAFFTGCAPTPRPVLTPLPEPPAKVVSVKEPSRVSLDTVIVPAGIDTSVAVAAALAARQVLVGVREESLATALFHQGQTEREIGKPLYDIFKKSRSPRETLSLNDSLTGNQYFGQAVKEETQGQKALGGRWVSEFDPQNLKNQPEAVRRRAAEYFERARDFYEQALSYNPWDAEARRVLIETYFDLGVLHLTLSDYDAAINAIENYLLLLGRDEYSQYYTLGECYLNKGDTLSALLQYRQAEDALISWAPFMGDSTAADLDSASHTDWMRIVERECLCEMTLGIGGSLTADLYRLKSACRTGVVMEDSIKTGAVRVLDWLSWDAGNVPAWRLSNQFKAAKAQKDWGEARRLARLLLDAVISPCASFEVEMAAADLDFYSIDQRDSALARMRELVNRAGFCEVDSCLDSLLKRDSAKAFGQRMNEQRGKLEKRIKDLLNLYGRMCIDRALDFEKKDRERAFQYFYQAALIPCNDQSFALCALALMSDNQAQTAILYGETALTPELATGLAKGDIKRLYTCLINAYRGLNDKPHADFYRQELLAMKNATPLKDPN